MGTMHSQRNLTRQTGPIARQSIEMGDVINPHSWLHISVSNEKTARSMKGG